ncbi:hypothetical protein AB6A40_010937 [Gnathostoma spinigerum]|uniref:MH1 domain-containing protein n=1 Tax=Gnathostoma spinigerum TaxID=75299 RepID=A0ABD6EWT1_9BILA
MKALFDNGTTNPSVRRLVDLLKNKPMNEDNGSSDDQWSEKAVKSLVKKLKKSKPIDELVKAISTEDPFTDCVCIPRSLDGRLQVSQRKCLPHVIYCRMWRYPDITSTHQLKSVAHCRFPFGKKLEQVCINPYHYEKVENPSLPAILIPKNSNQYGTSTTGNAGTSNGICNIGDLSAALRTVNPVMDREEMTSRGIPNRTLSMGDIESLSPALSSPSLSSSVSANSPRQQPPTSVGVCYPTTTSFVDSVDNSPLYPANTEGNPKYCTNKLHKLCIFAFF